MFEWEGCMRYILHSDLNNFYASVECLYRPEIRNSAVLVVGDEEKRHGIVLAKNYIAKRFGVQTGDTIWQAKQKCTCPVVCVPADFEKYLKISRIVKNIYKEYTNFVESFGIDEAWLDISKIVNSFEEAERLANEIRVRVINEVGLTVSIGVSFNKVFAKLASDMKKPNAVTVITTNNFKEKVWPLPVRALLFVGRRTGDKLERYNIKTIGDLANCKSELLNTLLGKNGLMIHKFANGLDNEPVRSIYQVDEIKSIGNSSTLPYDLTKEDEVLAIVSSLADSVVARMRKKNLYASSICLWIKDNTLNSCDHQKTLSVPTNNSKQIIDTCMQIFHETYTWDYPIRAVGVRVSHLSGEPKQYDLFCDPKTLFKDCNMDKVANELKKRYGHNVLYRASTLAKNLQSVNVEDERHQIHPISYIR